MSPHRVLRITLTLIALMMSVAGGPRSADAQSPNAAPFPAAASPHALVSLHEANTLGHLRAWTALSLSYANDPAIAQRLDQVTAHLIEHRVAAEIALGLGLGSRLEIMAALPFYLRQLREAYRPGGDGPDQSGPGDLRLGIKVRLWRSRGFGLAAAAELTLPTGDADDLMGAGVTTFVPRLIVDWRHRVGLRLVFNAAYRLRAKGHLEDLAMDDELLWGIGAEQDLGLAGLALGAELNASFGFGTLSDDEPAIAWRRTPMELLGLLRWRSTCGLVTTLAAGSGLTGGFGAADLRVIASIAWAVPERGCKTPEGQLRGHEGREHQNARRPAATRPAATRPTSPKPRRQGEAPGPLDAARFDALTRADPDPDGDGITSDRDACPNRPEDIDGFEDADGCPDLDNDHDGIPDAQDRCPLKAETINGISDDDGCPDKGKAQVVLRGGRLKLRHARIFFRSGSDVLDERSKPILRQVAASLRAYFTIRKLRVEGHTDDRGDKEMNVDLSERRARRVRAFLIAKGIATHRLIAQGYGPTRPIADNRSPQGRAKNRRVTFVVVKQSGLGQNTPSKPSRMNTPPKTQAASPGAKP